LGDARSVFLGLNPGVALPKYQYRDGILADEIRKAGRYSEVYGTTPANREPWHTDFGANKHHLNRIAFMRRWHDDPSLGDEHMLTFELYPWHSRRVLGAMRPHPDIIESMVFAPIAETGVRHVFAFGSPWLDVLDRSDRIEQGPESNLDMRRRSTTPQPAQDLACARRRNLARRDVGRLEHRRADRLCRWSEHDDPVLGPTLERRLFDGTPRTKGNPGPGPRPEPQLRKR
jgi:hypothetical protein